MKFEEIDIETYRNFWNKHPQKTFLSAPEMGDLHGNRKVFLFGVKNGGELKAAAMVRGTKNRFKKYDFYAPRGILIDYNDEKMLKFFVEKMKEFLQKEGGYVLRIEPAVLLKERNRKGEEVLGGENNEKIVKNLEKIGFKKVKYKEGTSQITWQFVLDVDGKTKDELLSEMKANTRRRLKQAEALGIEIKKLKYEELNEFYKVLCTTATRKKFEAREFEYFQKMYKAFDKRGEIEFVSAVINPKKSLQKMEDLRREIAKNEPKTIRERKDKVDSLKSIETRINKIKEAFPKIKDENVTLSSGMFMMMKPEILHLLGGNVGEYIKLDGQYILQWYMIQKALNNGYKRYNFYGIPENISEHPENYGIYEFKQGFGGHVEQLIGEFELPISSYYKIRQVLKKLHFVR